MTAASLALEGVTVEIGGIPILLETRDSDFCALLTSRYAGFVNPNATPAYRFTIELAAPSGASEQDVSVTRHGRFWHIDRGDFHAELNPHSGRGSIRQTANPYAIDTVLRIAHSLVLAEQGGFLLHSASAVRHGSAFLFAGVSGAGKTTISRLAPPDAAILTDEISYVRPSGDGYLAYGTPFAGELARVGENLCAPLKTAFLLNQGPVHRVDSAMPLEAARALLRHILFFAQDEELVRRVFESAVQFVNRVHVARLTFLPDSGVWEHIQ